MASSYPGGLDNFATNKNNATVMSTDHPAHHNDTADAINKIEAELGTAPSGVHATLKDRIEALEVFDIRKQGASTGSSDNSTAVLNAIDAAEAAGGGRVLVPEGTWEMEAKAILPYLASHGSIFLQGYGRGTSRLLWTVDLGAGEYAIDVSGSAGLGNNEVLDLTVEGPVWSSDPGEQNTLMHGINFGPKMSIRNCWITGFNAGIVVTGDHASVHDTQVGGSYYGLYFGPDAPTKGNHKFDNLVLEASMASMAIGSGNFSAGDEYSQVHWVGSAYGWLLEGGDPDSLAIGGNCFSGCAFESIGNRLVRDIDMNRKVQDNEFAGCGGTDLFAGHNIVGGGHDQNYAVSVGVWSSNKMKFSSGLFVPGALGIFEIGIDMSNNYWTYPSLEMNALTSTIVPATGTFSNGIVGSTTVVEYDRVKAKLIKISGACNDLDLLSYGGFGKVQKDASRVAAGVAQQAKASGASNDHVVMAYEGITHINCTGSITDGQLVMRDTGNAGKVIVAAGAASDDIVGVAIDSSSGGTVLTKLRGLS